jgi:hypothetical protein
VRAFVALCVLLAALPACAQQTVQGWPEVDTYIKLDPKVRVYLNAATTQEAGNYIGSDFGGSVDFFVKPLLKLKRFTFFELDESKSRLLDFRVGYHYLPTPGGPKEDRGVVEATSNFPLANGFLVSERNRTDQRLIGDVYSWRYRNRLHVERTVSIKSYHFMPYVRGEIYYDSAAGKWSRTAEDAGCVFPIHRRAEIEPYYEHLNDTSKTPNEQTDGIGLTLSLYFSPREH